MRYAYTTSNGGSKLLLNCQNARLQARETAKFMARKVEPTFLSPVMGVFDSLINRVYARAYVAYFVRMCNMGIMCSFGGCHSNDNNTKR